MSIPSQPTDPQRRNTGQGTGTPRPPTTDSGLTPPIVPPTEPPDYPDLDVSEDVPAPTVDPPAPRRPRLGQPSRGQRLARSPDNTPVHLTAEQRLLLLDTWRRSGLSAGGFAALVGLDSVYRQWPGAEARPPECAIVRHAPFPP